MWKMLTGLSRDDCLNCAAAVSSRTCHTTQSGPSRPDVLLHGSTSETDLNAANKMSPGLLVPLLFGRSKLETIHVGVV